MVLLPKFSCGKPRSPFFLPFDNENALYNDIDEMLIFGRIVREEEDEDGGCWNSKDD